MITDEMVEAAARVFFVSPSFAEPSTSGRDLVRQVLEAAEKVRPPVVDELQKQIHALEEEVETLEDENSLRITNYRQQRWRARQRC